MMQIVISACLASSPMICRDHSLTFTDVPLLQCTYSGGQQVAKWADDNPKWVVKKWKCRVPGLEARI